MSVRGGYDAREWIAFLVGWSLVWLMRNDFSVDLYLRSGISSCGDMAVMILVRYLRWWFIS